MVVTDGFEPSVSGLSARRSDQLSYATIKGEGGGVFTRSSELIEITQYYRLRLPEQGGALDVFTVLWLSYPFESVPEERFQLSAC